MALLAAAGVLLSRVRTGPVALQVLGAAGFVVVAFCHLFEALHVFPSMGWGRHDSPGHYIDLASAIVGIVLFPLGYLLHVLERRRRGS